MTARKKLDRRKTFILEALALLALLTAGCGGGTPAAEGAAATPASPAPPDAPASALPEMPSTPADASFFASLGIDLERELSVVGDHLATAAVAGAGAGARPATAPSLSDYETPLPHTTQPKLSKLERTLLTAYLDHPDAAALSQYLAIHHLWRSLLRPTPPSERGEALKHTLYALYFLNRARDTGATGAWITPVLDAAQAAVDAVFETSQPITSDEYHDAHVFYRQTFHLNQEQNRYEALDKLLQDFSQEPNNVYTSFVLTAINLWMGGEADYDDPTTLYNYVLGSYFSLHTIDLAHRLELAFNSDPVNVKRFRMAAELGGFSLLQRRWLAKVHRDEAAIALIDDEHRKWFAIQPAFHSFTFALPYFDEPEHFMEGLKAYGDGFAFCDKLAVRTCIDQPRFAFNLLGFVLGYADYLLKAGQVDAARQMLAMNQQVPPMIEAWKYWDIGRDAWQHRVDNAEAIAALYANGDPSDDPINFEMTRRKWGEDTTTCQECHQTQSNAQAQAAVEQPQLLPPEQIASLTDWPAVTSAWYGAAPK